MRTSHHSFVSSLTAAEPQKIVYIPWTLLCSIIESQFANHCCVSLIYNGHTIFPTNIFLILESTSVKNTTQAVWIKPVNHKPTRHLLPLWNFLFFFPSDVSFWIRTYPVWRDLAVLSQSPVQYPNQPPNPQKDGGGELVIPQLCNFLTTVVTAT